MLGVNTAVLASGAAIYPLLGGYLATISWNAPFVAYLGGLSVAAFAWVVLPKTVAAVGERKEELSCLRRAASNLAQRSAIVPYGTAFLTEVLLFGVVITTLPFVLDDFGVSTAFVGLALTAAEVVSAAVAAANGWLAGRLSDEEIIALGYLAYGVGPLVAWLDPSLAGVVVGAVILGRAVDPILLAGVAATTGCRPLLLGARIVGFAGGVGILLLRR